MKTFHNILEYMTGAIFNIIFIVLAIAAISFVGTRAFSFGIELFHNDTSVPFEEFTIEIPAGEENPYRADALAVGRILQEYGLTRNAWIFFLESRLNGLFQHFRPGTYVFNTHMANNEMMYMMQRAQFAPAEDIRITIREGVTIQDIGRITENMGLWTMDDWLYATRNYGPQYFFLIPTQWRDNPLEGYLFPDTYRLPMNPYPNDLIGRMLNRFQEKFCFEMEDRADYLGLTIDEVVIIASIIEMEARIPAERYKVSSIIHNRLRLGMNLEMCSTVIYAHDIAGIPIGSRENISIANTQINSPWNTYRNPGLPAGPITNPGEDAIRAALYPADTNYLFMVLIDPATGAHSFNTNFADHERDRLQHGSRDF